jgi:peptidoglycan/xylan/chitin deacetylase (PgdA/CDA1 family)
MYHHIGELSPNADTIRRDLTVSAENFEAQMALLLQKGYETISIEDLVTAFEGTRELPPKPMILTFDDGYKDNFEYAYPILRKYGLKGTFFIITSLVGTKGYLTWDDIVEMAKCGMYIGAHGSTHADLSVLSYDGVVQQVTEATQALQSHVNVIPRVYCYPAGKFNQTVINILREKGYRAAVGTRYGCIHNREDLFQLRRTRMSGSDSLSTFGGKIECQSPN